MPTKTLTDEQINQAHELLAALDAGGSERRKNFPLFDESDFAAGGFTIMAALGLWECIPAGRILGLLRGESLKLGPKERRPTDSDRLRHYEQLVSDIREGNSWHLPGQEIARITIVIDQTAHQVKRDRVGIADGYGGGAIYQVAWRNSVDNTSACVSQRGMSEDDILADLERYAVDGAEIQYPHGEERE